jgi:hypothetical protein
MRVRQASNPAGPGLYGPHIMRLSFCWFVLALSSISVSAFAQGNDLYGPVGGRSTLMGNTGVALASDGAAPLYNPATIVRIRDERLAFSAHFFSFTLQHFSDWHQPGEIDSDQFGSGSLSNTAFTTDTFHLPPSTVCLFLTLQGGAKSSTAKTEDESSRDSHEVRQKLAICFASLESETVGSQAIQFTGMTGAGPTMQVQSLARDWDRTYVGPTYGVNVNEHLAFGGSMQVVYTYTSFGLNGTTLGSTLDGGGAATSLAVSGSGYTFGLVGLLGMTYRVGLFTLGVSARTPVLQITGSYKSTYERSVMGVSQSEDSIIQSATGNLRTAPPIRLAIGAGLSLSKLTLELDAALNVPMQNAMSSDLNVAESRLTSDGVEQKTWSQHYEVRTHTTINPSAGAEFKLNAGLSLFTGISANFTALGSLSPTDSVGNLVQARTSHANATFGVGSYWDGGELLLGLQFDYGWGQTMAINPYLLPNHFSVVDSSTSTLMFILAGAANLKSVMSTVNKITGSND